MDYPAWRISFQSSEQAARAAFNELLIVKGLLAETRADAERYRWLRDKCNHVAIGVHIQFSSNERDADEAIDDAMIGANGLSSGRAGSSA